MDATPRFRLFDSRRGGLDHEEGGPQTLPRRRMVTSVSVARARRRNRRRPGTRRGPAFFIPRLLSLFGARSSRRRRAVFVLLLAVCAAGALVSARLIAWVLSSSSSSSATSFSPLKPPARHVSSSGGVADASSGGDNADRPRDDQRGRRPAVSLGPDAIPSVVLVERRPAGGARRASSLDAGGDEGEDTEGEGRDGNHSQPPHGCLSTAQGAVLFADSEGRVCPRSEVGDVHRPGCCAARPPPLPRGAGGGDDGALAAPEGSVDQDVAASHVGAVAAAAASVGAAGVRRGGVAQLAWGGDGVGEGGFPPEQALSTPFSCWSCDEGGDRGDNGGGDGYSSCCWSYEFCVSCCQAPWREQEREAIREAAARAGHPVYRELGLINDGGGGRGGGSGGTDWFRNKSPHQVLRGAEGEGSPAAQEGEQQARETREAAFAHCAFRCRTYSGSVAHENSYRGPLKHCFGRFRPPVAAPGVLAVGAPGQAVMLAGGGGEVVTSGGGQEVPPLQLDPFLADLA